MKKLINKKSAIQCIIGVIALAIIIPTTSYITSWERKFTLTEVGYDTSIKSMKYSLTNNTNNYYEVDAIIKCYNRVVLPAEEWTYTKYIDINLGPNATQSFFLYDKDLEESMPKDMKLSYPEQIIHKIIYKKK